MPKAIQPGLLIGDIQHSWEVDEYDQHERPKAWYVFMSIFGVVFVVYGMLSGNFLFALIILLAGIILFLQSHQTPLRVPIGITDLGVIVNNRFYSYSEFEGFYIIYNPPEVKTVFLETTSLLRPTLRIPLMDQNPMDIRYTLGEYLVEDVEKEEEPAVDTFARRWKMH